MSSSVEKEAGIVIGIDATNLLMGGGRTHITELLRTPSIDAHGIRRVVVWGTRETLGKIDSREWIQKESSPLQSAGIIGRLIWQALFLSRAAKKNNCDVLFVPGGVFSSKFSPIVTMSRNLLPFEPEEAARYGWSVMRVKLAVLRLLQGRSIRQASGVIFLSEYAQRKVLEKVGKISAKVTIIPHGLNERFRSKRDNHEQESSNASENTYRFIYASTVDVYKHQWNVIEAIARVRQLTGLAISLDLVGAVTRQGRNPLRRAVRNYDPEGRWITVHGQVSYEKLHEVYARADFGIFASTCENMPNIVIEKMASRLPLAVSNRGPMPELLREAALYFDPTSVDQIVGSIMSLVENPNLAKENARLAYLFSKEYSWAKCRLQTFMFLTEVGKSKRTNHAN